MFHLAALASESSWCQNSDNTRHTLWRWLSSIGGIVLFFFRSWNVLFMNTACRKQKNCPLCSKFIDWHIILKTRIIGKDNRVHDVLRHNISSHSSFLSVHHWFPSSVPTLHYPANDGQPGLMWLWCVVLAVTPPANVNIFSLLSAVAATSNDPPEFGLGKQSQHTRMLRFRNGRI